MTSPSFPPDARSRIIRSRTNSNLSAHRQDQGRLRVGSISRSRSRPRSVSASAGAAPNRALPTASPDRNTSLEFDFSNPNPAPGQLLSTLDEPVDRRVQSADSIAWPSYDPSFRSPPPQSLPTVVLDTHPAQLPSAQQLEPQLLFRQEEQQVGPTDMSAISYILPSQFGVPEPYGAVFEDSNDFVMNSYSPDRSIPGTQAASPSPSYTQSYSLSPALGTSSPVPSNQGLERRHSEKTNYQDPNYPRGDYESNIMYAARQASLPNNMLGLSYTLPAASAPPPMVSVSQAAQYATPQYSLPPSHSLPSIDFSQHLPSPPGQYLPSFNMYDNASSTQHMYAQSQSMGYPVQPAYSSNFPEPPRGTAPLPGAQNQVRVVDSRPKPQCWEHGCNGRQFSTFSNLLRHQREKSGTATKSYCPRCGAEFTRTTARNGHMAHDKCKPKRDTSSQHSSSG